MSKTELSNLNKSFDLKLYVLICQWQRICCHLCHRILQPKLRPSPRSNLYLTKCVFYQFLAGSFTTVYQTISSGHTGSRMYIVLLVVVQNSNFRDRMSHEVCSKLFGWNIWMKSSQHQLQMWATLLRWASSWISSHRCRGRSCCSGGWTIPCSLGDRNTLSIFTTLKNHPSIFIPRQKHPQPLHHLTEPPSASSFPNRPTPASSSPNITTPASSSPPPHHDPPS